MTDSCPCKVMFICKYVKLFKKRNVLLWPMTTLIFTIITHYIYTATFSVQCLHSAVQNKMLITKNMKNWIKGLNEIK